MKSKQIIILVIILGVILVLGILKNASRANLIHSSLAAKPTISFDEKSIDKIELKKSEFSQVILSKAKSEWRIPSKWNALADQTIVESLFNTLKQVRAEAKADRPDVFKDFQITDGESFHVIFSAGPKQILHLILSPKVPEQGGIFFRLNGSNVIYFTDEPIFALFGIFGEPKTQDFKEDYWTGLSLVHFDLAQINSAVLRRFEKENTVTVFELTRTASAKWNLKDANSSREINTEKAESYLKRLKKEQAKDVLDPSKDYGINAPTIEIALKLIDGSEKSIRLKETPKDAKEKGYYANISGEKEVYLISQYTFEAFNVSSEFFADKPTPSPS